MTRGDARLPAGELTNEQATAEDDLVLEVQQALDRHFICWRDFTDTPGRGAGEWYCGCGHTFEWSGTAIEHQVGEVIGLIVSRLAAAGVDALIDAARELELLNAIATTPADLVPDTASEWFHGHPLQAASTRQLLSETLPPFAVWLRERAGDDTEDGTT